MFKKLQESKCRGRQWARAESAGGLEREESRIRRPWGSGQGPWGLQGRVRRVDFTPDARTATQGL